MQIEAKLAALGLVLPDEAKVPPGITTSFAWVRLRGNRAYISGHGPLNPDGSVAGPYGKVGVDVSPEDAYQSARLAALAVLGSLKRALGDLDRVTAWLMVNGMVNAIPGSSASTNAINGFSDLILELYGPEIGQHARTAVGMAALPLNLPIVVAAEVEIAPEAETAEPTQEEAILEQEA
jgi:enamine deaminase RidA (YjgF/YER057c/UK114 family)